MTLTIEIDRLRLRAFHGVMPQERAAGNIFEVSLRLTCPTSDETLGSDDPSTVIDYSVAAEIVKKEMAVPSALLENVAWRIRRALLRRYPAIVGRHGQSRQTYPADECRSGSRRRRNQLVAGS